MSTPGCSAVDARLPAGDKRQRRDPTESRRGRQNSGRMPGYGLLGRSYRRNVGYVVKLSILMPVYNEEDRIADALKQALAVDYPCEVELVVVDDGSRDRTAESLGNV